MRKKVTYVLRFGVFVVLVLEIAHSNIEIAHSNMYLCVYYYYHDHHHHHHHFIIIRTALEKCTHLYDDT